MADKKGLGRGLSALLGEDKEVTSAISKAPISETSSISSESSSEENNISRESSIREVLLSELEVSPLQPRTSFDEESLKGMVESIKEKGILQPLLVREMPDGKYEIIAGERRFRSATEAGIAKVPVIIRNFSDQEVLEVALIENLQRENLNAIEEAYGYKKLLEEFHHTQEELAKVVGKSRSHVANTLRLTSLSAPIKDMVVDGQISAGHARALLTAKEPEKLAKKIITNNLSVRQTEKLASTTNIVKDKEKTSKKSDKTLPSYQKDADIVSLEKEIEKQTGLKVTINFDGAGGELILFYDNLEQLDSMVQKLCMTEATKSATEEVEIGITPEHYAEDFDINLENKEVKSYVDDVQSNMDMDDTFTLDANNISDNGDDIFVIDNDSSNEENIINPEIIADVSISEEDLRNKENKVVGEEFSYNPNESIIEISDDQK